MKTISVDGVQHTFPDDATDTEIKKALGRSDVAAIEAPPVRSKALRDAVTDPSNVSAVVSGDAKGKIDSLFGSLNDAVNNVGTGLYRGASMAAGLPGDINEFFKGVASKPRTSVDLIRGKAEFPYSEDMRAGLSPEEQDRFDVMKHGVDLPTSDRIQDFVFKDLGVPEYKPTTRAGRMVEKTAEGVGSTLGLGGPIGLLMGASGGAGTSAAEELFPNSKAAPIIGGLLGVLAGGSVAKLRKPLADIMEESLKNSKLPDAVATQRLGTEIGSPVTGPEALNDPTLLRYQQLAEQSPKGGKLRELMQDRPRTQRNAVDIAINPLGDSSVTPATASGRMSKAAGDVAGDERKAVDDQLQRATQPLQEDVERYNANATGRVTDAASENLTKNDYYGSLDALGEQQQTAAAPLYKEFFASNKSMGSPVIDRILATPAGQDALGYARTRMQNRMARMATPDKELTEQYNQLVARGDATAVRGGVALGLKAETLDLIKQALSDQERALKRQVQTGTARAGELVDIGDLRRDLTREMDKLDVTAKAGPNSLKPEGGAYQRARNAYADPARLKDAMESGLEWGAEDVGSTRRSLADLGEGERDAYRTGVVQDILTQAQKNPEAVTKKLGQTFYREKLAAIFPDEEKLNDFYRAISDRTIPDMAEEKIANLQDAAKSAVEDINKSLIGKVEKSGDITAQANLLLDPDKIRPDEIKVTLGRLGQKDPEAAPHFIKMYVDNAMDKAMTKPAQGGIQNAGGKFYTAIAGTPYTKANLRAAYSAIPDGDIRYQALEKTLKVFEAQSQRLPVGSPTAEKGMLLDKLTGAKINPRFLDAFQGWLDRARTAGRLGDMAELFARSDSVEEMARIARLNPGSRDARIAIGAFLGDVPAAQETFHPSRPVKK